MILAQEPNLLGDDLLAWLTLAIAGALVVGTTMALFKPRTTAADGELLRPPLVRSMVQIVIGLAAAVWALATLLA